VPFSTSSTLYLRDYRFAIIIFCGELTGAKPALDASKTTLKMSKSVGVSLKVLKQFSAVLISLLSGCAAGPSNAETVPSAATKEVAENSALKVSISPFPYDKTAEAVDTVNRIIQANANVYTVQLDNGIPWEAALAGKPFPKEVNETWERHKKAIGRKTVYLAIAPLAEDRTSWAPSAAGEKTPSWAKDEKQASSELKQAYARYVLKAVDYFHPEFLNIGVEAGDMATKKPGKWPAFEQLFSETENQVHAKFPGVKVGISFSLPLLMKSGVKERAQNLIDQSDYAGISFYPFMTEFYSKIGGVRLPAPPDQWREPLNWLSTNIKKPIAICETAYSTQPVELPKYKIKLEGDPNRQIDYVRDLAAIARRDHYLFTVFFLSVDYVPLLKQLPAGDGSAGMWAYTGFFDEHLKEKPSWQAYQQAWLGKKGGAVTAAKESEAKIKPNSTQPSAPTSSELAFNSQGDLFQAPASDKISLETVDGKSKVMRWKYEFRPKEFAWSVKEIRKNSGSGSSGIAFDLKSDQEGAILLQVEQADGGAFFTVIHPGKTWTKQQLAWNDFSVDPKKGYKGKLSPEQITRMMLVDASSVDRKVSGTRTLEIANLEFMRNSR